MEVKDPSVFGPQIIVYIRTEDQSLEEMLAILFVFHHLISFPDIYDNAHVNMKDSFLCALSVSTR